MGLVDTCCTVTYVTLYLQRAEESDSGRYTVLATNIAGEAQSIADIFVEDEVSSEEEREVCRAFQLMYRMALCSHYHKRDLFVL